MKQEKTSPLHEYFPSIIAGGCSCINNITHHNASSEKICLFAWIDAFCTMKIKQIKRKYNHMKSE